MNGKGWKSTFNKPWFILQTKYLRSERIRCTKIHRVLTRGTVALGKASYHSPCITDCTEVLHTAIGIIWGVLSHMLLKVDTDKYLNWSQAKRKWEKSKHGWQAGPVHWFSLPPLHLCVLLHPWLPSQGWHIRSESFSCPPPSPCVRKRQIERLLRKYTIQDIYMPLLLNHHHGAPLWPAAPLPFTSFAEGCRAHVGPEPTFPPPSTLAVVEDAQSSKDPNLTLDRGDHFPNTFETLEVKPEANKSQKNSNMRNTQTAWFLQLHIV